MEKTFEIRTYGFGELAQLYFPHVTKSSASRMLGMWIQTNENIIRSLTEVNWRKRAKYLTPKQVKVLVDYFDAPY